MVDGDEPARPLAKRQKIQASASEKSKRHWRDRGKNQATATAGICGLPLELLAEALSYLQPIDILALARTSKYFTNTLTGNAAVFIWKGVRKSCCPAPIVDPTPNWTESALAAFLFDDAACFVCNNRVITYPISYTTRVFLCEKMICKTKFMTGHVKIIERNAMQQSPFTARLAHFEQTSHPSGFTSGLTTTVFFKKDHFLEEEREYLRVQTLDDAARLAYDEQTSRRKQVNSSLTKWAGAMQAWGPRHWQQKQVSRHSSRQTIAAFGRTQGWPNDVVGNSETLLSLRRSADRSLASVTLEDLKCYLSAIENDLRNAKLAGERSVRAEKLKLLASIKNELYTNMIEKRSKSLGMVPTENEFGKFSALTTLEGYDTDVIRDMKAKGFVAKTLENNLKAWQVKVKDEFGTIFGHERWISISSTVLHPADRVNALLQCKECNSIPQRNAILGTLTVKDACVHFCRKSVNKKRRAKLAWNSAMFKVDEKAEKICREAVSKAGHSVETVTMETMQAIGSSFVCKSCPSLVLMDFKSVIGHCHRHDDMQVELVTKQMSSAVLKHNIQYGLSHKMRFEIKPGARQFGCRLCGQDSKGRFIFDGLRSHMKAKHRIESLRDEDFFQMGDK